LFGGQINDILPVEGEPLTIVLRQVGGKGIADPGSGSVGRSGVGDRSEPQRSQRQLAAGTKYGLPTLWSAPGREMSRTTSPDGFLDAVVIEDDPGAMSSFIYNLYLVPKGAKVSYSKSDPYVVNTSEGDELKTSWEKPHFLQVRPGNAHIKWFANLWYSDKFPNYYVELRLAMDPTKTYLQPDGRLRGSN
jgi:hypothetical protein